jgi:hypothetical protein
MTNTHRLPSASSPTSSPTADLSIREILQRWVGTDETLRAALNAHNSDSNRRAEEERTRQEFYRFETRRVEYDILREAFRGGIHPSLIPQLFSPDRAGGPQSLSPISPITRQDDRPSGYPTSSLPSYSRHDLPRIDTTNLPLPHNRHLVPSRDKYAGPTSAPPASMATTSPPPSIFFRHWAPPQPRNEDIGLRTPREDSDPSRYHHEHQIPSPSSARKSPPQYASNGISPKRGSGSHGRQRSDAPLSGKLHESRHHPYSARPLQKKHETEENGLGGTKSPLDRETVMRALREKVGPRRNEDQEDQDKRESEKKELAERKKGETRDVMALEQLVESNGTPPKV